MHLYETVVIGAGPYGLALSSELRRAFVDHVVIGLPMESWRAMPTGMQLRSLVEDSNFSHRPELSFGAWLREQEREHQLKYRIPSPDDQSWTTLSREQLLLYSDWFIKQTGVKVIHDLVQHLSGEDRGFQIRLRSGRLLASRTVVVSVGMHSFSVLPDELMNIPEGFVKHTSELENFDDWRGKNILVIGGGQSAYEWAALAAERGVKVQMIQRSKPRGFGTVDFVALRDTQTRTELTPAWFRQLDEAAQIVNVQRPRRSKNDAWLLPRLRNAGVQGISDVGELTSAELRDGRVTIHLQDGREITADAVLCGTGYRVEMSRLTFIDNALRDNVEILGQPSELRGFPILDTSLQSSVKGLYFTGYSAIGSFGGAFNFLAGASPSARLITSALSKARELT